MREHEPKKIRASEKTELQSLTTRLVKETSSYKPNDANFTIFEKKRPPDTSETTARRKGKLELADPEIKPLNPTPITEEAKERLMSWGMSEEDIKTLREITSSFRYDLCEQKAERLAQSPAYIYTAEDGSEEVIIPNFFDTSDRGDGQCRDIATQQIRALNMSDFFNEMNERLAKEKKTNILPVFMYGQSRTHFHKEGAGHAWLGLLPEGEQLENFVVVDASFQEISNADTNEYKFDPKRADINPSSYIGYETASTIPLGRYTENEKGDVAIDGFKQLTVLGSSFDGQFYYWLTFIKDTETGEIKPDIEATDADGKCAQFYTYSRSGKIISGEAAPNFTLDHLIEGRLILSSLRKIPLVRDQEEAERIRNEKITIPLMNTLEN